MINITRKINISVYLSFVENMLRFNRTKNDDAFFLLNHIWPDLLDIITKGNIDVPLYERVLRVIRFIATNGEIELANTYFEKLELKIKNAPMHDDVQLQLYFGTLMNLGLYKKIIKKITKKSCYLKNDLRRGKFFFLRALLIILNSKEIKYPSKLIDEDVCVYIKKTDSFQFLYTRITDVEVALKLIKSLYLSDKCLKNQYALLGWQQKEESLQSALKLMKKDLRRNRLTPVWKARTAQLYAKSGNVQKAQKLITEVYKEDSDIENQYALLGWQQKEESLQLALKLMKKDLRRNRLTPLWKARTAQLYAKSGYVQKAKKLISEVYKEDSDIQNQYALLGWQQKEESLQSALKLMKKDLRRNRLAPLWKARTAQLYAKSGNVQKAKKLISEVYKEDSDIQNQYALLGWQQKEESLQSALKLMKKDLRHNRLTPLWKARMAQLYAKSGNVQKAKKLISAAYKDDTDIQNQYAFLGWQQREESRPLALKLMKKDLRLNRLTPLWKINTALVFSLNGRVEKSFELVEQAYLESKEVIDGYSGIARRLRDEQKLSDASSLALIERDIEQGRASDDVLRYYVILKAYCSSAQDVTPFIIEAYQHNKKLTDLYCLSGWGEYLRSGDNQTLTKFIQRETTRGRISKNSLIVRAANKMLSGNSDEAFSLIKEKKTGSQIHDGYSVLGWLCYKKGQISKSSSLMQIDYQNGAMSEHWLINYSYLLLETGQLEKFQEIKENELKRLSKNKIVKIGFPLSPEKMVSWGKLVNNPKAK